MKPIRVLLADDHSLLRMGLAALLKFHKDIEVVGSAENGEEAVQLARKQNPELVIMDLMMPVMDGVEATRLIRQSCPNTRILILTTFGTSVDVSRAIAAGASGAIMKDATNNELLTAIHTVVRGDHAYSTEIERIIREDPPPAELTAKQQGILESVTRGLTNRDIAIQFGISSDAVKQHLNTICAKLNAANRSEAVAIALRKHLLKI